ncbi:MAG: GxxExxY protein [Lacipirellulaceae bacterium]
MKKLLHESITEDIIGSAFEVHNYLGYGFLEKVYQRAMQVELLSRNRACELERKLVVKYKNVIVGDYSADLFVEDVVIVELKVAKQLNVLDDSQLLNELQATGEKVGLLINFGKEKVEFTRMVN